MQKQQIPSITQLESDLLADSTTADLELPTDTPQDAKRVLSADQVRHDVSTFARCLINAYSGWPFMSDLEKRKVLVALKHIQDNARDNTTAVAQFFFQSCKILRKLCSIIRSGDALRGSCVVASATANRARGRSWTPCAR